jgi:peptidyl-prolyl cis-trans isomerase D
VMSVLYIPRLVTAADSAAVRNHVNQLRAEIAGGAKFDDVAKRESVDTVSAAQGGDLGKVTKGRMVPAFEQAAFALKPGELSQPVLTQYGYHLIRMDSRAGDTVSLRHILLRIQPSDSSAAKVDREADRLAKLAAGHDNPKALDSAAKVLGLTPFTVVASQGEAAQHDGREVPSVSAWAFRDAKRGDISELFDAEDGYYIARLDSLFEGGKRFDAVKGAVRARMATEKAIDRTMPIAARLAAAARSSSLESAAAQMQAPVVKTGMTTRGGAVRAFGSLGEAIGAAFVMPLNTVSDPIRQADGVYVVRTDERKPADKATFEKQLANLRGRQLDFLRRQRLQAFLADLRTTASISDRRKEISAQLRRQSAS